MVWLILVFFYQFATVHGPGATSNSTSAMLHVGTFTSIADCENAANAARIVGRPSEQPGFSFVCVSSGTLN